MIGNLIEKRGCYAKRVGERIWLACKTKSGPWRGIVLDFENQKLDWADRKDVRTRSMAKEWVDRSAHDRRVDDRSNREV